MIICFSFPLIVSYFISFDSFVSYLIYLNNFVHGKSRHRNTELRNEYIFVKTKTKTKEIVD